MFGVILKTTNSPFQKGMTFCHSIYVKKVMKQLAFIFGQPSYVSGFCTNTITVIIKDNCRLPYLLTEQVMF